MPTSNWTRAVIALFAAVIVLLAVVTGESIDKNGLRWVTGASAAVVLLLMLYDKWVWRWRFIRRGAEWSGRPVLHGTWKGGLHFERDAQNKPGSITLYVAVDQRFSSVSVRSFAETSESHSLTATIERPARSQRQLVFAYRSEAPYPDRDGNRPHDGTCVLSIVGIPVEELTGSYYNDRLRRGTIRLTDHCPKVAESFAQAERQSYRTRTAR